MLGVLGFGSLVLGAVVRQRVAIGVGVGLLGGSYATHLVLDDPPLDARAPLVATGLLLAAELGFWSIELRRESTRERGRHLRRLIAEIGLCLGGLLVSALVLAAADLSRLGGLAVELTGAAAAVALAWLAVDALRRPPA